MHRRSSVYVWTYECVYVCAACFVKKKKKINPIKQRQRLKMNVSERDKDYNYILQIRCVCVHVGVCACGQMTEVNLKTWKRARQETYNCKIFSYGTYSFLCEVRGMWSSAMSDVVPLLTWALCCLRGRWQASSPHCCTPGCYCRHKNTSQ